MRDFGLKVMYRAWPSRELTFLPHATEKIKGHFIDCGWLPMSGTMFKMHDQDKAIKIPSLQDGSTLESASIQETIIDFSKKSITIVIS